MSVNTEFVERWCDALESGEFPQTRFVLHRLTDGVDDLTGDPVPAGYCCIGVACVLAGIPERRVRFPDDLFPDESGHTYFDDSASAAPVGLRLVAGESIYFAELALKNDNGATFPEIAEFIRSRYL